MAHVHPLTAPVREAPRSSWEYRCVYGVGFALCISVVSVARLLPVRWRPWPSTGRTGSILAEAKGATDTIVPFAFMG